MNGSNSMKSRKQLVCRPSPIPMAQPLPTDDNEVEFGATLIALKNNSGSGSGSGSSEQVC
jgi:hypothetical protein